MYGDATEQGIAPPRQAAKIRCAPVDLNWRIFLLPACATRGIGCATSAKAPF
jgi:hypothetical protein